MERVQFDCAECGGVAATIELLPPTDDPITSIDFGYDQWRLRVDGAVRISHWVLDGLDAVQAAMAQGTVEALRAIDTEYVSGWCPTCAALYCATHWAPIERTMDDGFYDATYGTCPKGHRVMLDD